MSKFIEIKHLKANDKAIEKITNKIIEGGIDERDIFFI